MKNSIFLVKDKEELSVMKKLMGTPFGRQYFMLSSFIIFIVIVALIISVTFIYLQYVYYGNLNYILILLSILNLMIILCASLFAKMKWLDLVKEYYEESK